MRKTRGRRAVISHGEQIVVEGEEKTTREGQSKVIHNGCCSVVGVAVPGSANRSATGTAALDWKIPDNRPFTIAQHRNKGVGFGPLTVV